MKKAIFRSIPHLIIPLIFVACSSKINELRDVPIELSLSNQYLKSGTVKIGFDVPHDLLSNIRPLDRSINFDFRGKENLENPPFQAAYSCETTSKIHPFSYASMNQELETGPSKKSNLSFAPLVGFFPLSIQFKPADNEIWIQIVKDKNQIEVYKGQEILKVIPTEGSIKLAAGEYPLQHKQRNPLWYAPDEYFSRRELRVPPRGDHFRYRRGALGNYALYPTMDFVIHSGPFWSEEVGGLKVSETDLASIFIMLNIGTPIIVK